MAQGRDTVDAEGHDSSEAEALLNETWLSSQEDGQSSSTESMAARARAILSANKSISDTSYEANELALQPLGDSQDLDSAQLRAQGHEAALERSFSPLAALGLGFRYKLSVKKPFHD
jgi:hypothetical protein